MVNVENVKIGERHFQYVSMNLGNAPLLILRGEQGYVMCGYLSLETAEKLGDAAVRVTGVKDLDSLLGAVVSGRTTKASELGIEVGVKVSSVIKFL
ncbi:MAG: DUF1805 domain-containing protein [Thermoplasmatales archaeon]|nr:DUF1805 domain-containing protein [Thermoplasmatales archaeon]MCW6170056.1 DUF1805 domain-containing protein [Thermoplasmatales archaeon]